MSLVKGAQALFGKERQWHFQTWKFLSDEATGGGERAM